jgi:hypothetical protein
MKFPLAGGKYRKPDWVIATLLCYSGLAVWFFHFHVWYQYDRTRGYLHKTGTDLLCISPERDSAG